MLKQLAAVGAVVIMVLGAGAAAAEHMPGHSGRDNTQESGGAAGNADIAKHKGCPHCGMDREKFAHSRMLITYADGVSVGVCSLHCAATEMKAAKGKSIKSVEVGDLNSKKLVDAEKAAWVIGGSRRGVMSRTAKWAFAKKDDADAFIRKNGGKPATYKEALALAGQD